MPNTQLLTKQGKSGIIKQLVLKYKFMNTKLKTLLTSKSPRENAKKCGCTKLWICTGCGLGICKC